MMDPAQISIFDTSVGSDNIGDHIIMNDVFDVMNDIFPNTHFWTLPTHDQFGKHGERKLARSSMALVGGSNIMSDRLPRRGGWKIPRARFPFVWRSFDIPNLVLCAVGWKGEKFRKNNYFSEYFKKNLLTGVPVSCRDEYTKLMFERYDIEAVNTSCVTLWPYASENGYSLKHYRTKSRNALVTVNQSKSAVELDRRWIEVVRDAYERVNVWPQCAGDLDYAVELGFAAEEIVPSNLTAYISALNSEEKPDYVGVRLHGGIRALRNGCRSIILSVDNRAREIGRDTSLPVCARDDVGSLVEWIDFRGDHTINIPSNSIEAWKASLLEAVQSQKQRKFSLLGG